MEVNKWLPTNITCLSGLKEERKMGDEKMVFKRIALCGHLDEGGLKEIAELNELRKGHSMAQAEGRTRL